MFVHLFSRAISSWFAFALPLFRSFQALHHRPASEPVIERLTKYWTVVGALLAFEYSVEFLISWFPFYWELKLLLLLFISLPQVQGSTYVYDTLLAPVLSRNELYIDHQIELAQENFLVFFQAQTQAILGRILGKVQATEPGSASMQEGGTTATSTIQNAARLTMGFLTAHGISLAGKTDATGMADSRAGDSPLQAPSSTSVYSPSIDEARRRSGIVSESQASLPVTPEHVYQAQTSRSSDINDLKTPPAFPEPKLF